MKTVEVQSFENKEEIVKHLDECGIENKSLIDDILNDVDEDKHLLQIDVYDLKWETLVTFIYEDCGVVETYTRKFYKQMKED